MKHKTLLQLSVSLILIGVFGAIFLDDMGYFPHATASFLSIPVASYDTDFLLGWILSGMTCAGLILLTLSLRHKVVLTTCACLTAVILMPHFFS